MRKTIGAVCAFLGAFLVIVAILAQTWAAGELKKTPLDVDSVTRLSGDAVQYTAAGISPFRVKATSTTKADSEKSDDDVVVFAGSTCLVKDANDVGDCVSAEDPLNRLLSAGFEDFATDRRSAEAVNDPKYLPADAEEREGLINKWPFDAEKKTYTYWIGPGSTEATYDRTEEVDGLETYVYHVETEPAPITIAEGLEGTYQETTDLWIEPRTGQIVDQVSEQVRTANGQPFLTLNLSFTDEQVAENVDDIGGDADLLKLVTSTVPLIGYLVGIPLLIIGIALLLLNRRQPPSAKDRARESELAKA
ncbi:MAG TPA: DUF3068 domain-containing protein [Nocardioides sp.]|uniref:DUF3068 domain-containing protein n=1 Tax=Nocardioides sp. TaxID=35761 RepID=UPI002B8CF3C5|nr:DUF3068 domain-containing protein [Nocardioides sp.]HTW15167.1 DUF3068 domain-containing protein [Nocardioides sp.]